LVGTGAPPVVAVVVTRDPGSWFEETLESIYRQDYGNLAVLVVDNGSADDPTPRVGSVLPQAFVKRLGEDVGLSAAINEAMASVEGAVFVLVCHDDVRLEPDAITNLVAEAFRANAGVVGPKFVEWDRPDVLASVGLAVDAYGASSSLVDPGEIDQSQHDTPREVFAVSDACVLVRADLLGSLGGFSEDIPYFGEDVDLCWRAHAAGAAVQYCPRAVVRHRGRFVERRRVEDLERYELRHQVRMLLANTSLRRLPKMVLLALLASLADVFGSLLSGRFRRVGEIAGAVGWNVLRLPRTVGARRRLARVRQVPDARFASLVSRGSYRLRSLWRTEDGASRLGEATRSGREYLVGLSSGTSRAAALLIVVSVTVLLVGSRNLFTDPLPVFREFASNGRSAGDLIAEWWHAWRWVGLGESAVPPGAVTLPGVVGWLLLGSVGLARRLLLVLPLLVGALGAWKLFARTGSVRARAATLAAYGLNPVALNAIATGRLQALVAYAAAPWFIRRVATHARVAPFLEQTPTGEGRRSGGGPFSVPLLRHLAGDALLLGAVAWFTPVGAALLVATAVVLAAGLGISRSAGSGRATAMAGRALGGALLSVPLWCPWLFAAVATGDLASITGVWSTRAPVPGAADLVTGSIGPVDVQVLGWGVVVAAIVPLLTGRGWRFGWALGGWLCALASWGAAAALADAGWVGGAGVALFLVPGSVGTMVSVGMGPLAFEEDVVAGDFGAPQLLSGVALAALVVGLVPVAVAANQGRWYQPDGDFQRVLSLVDGPGDYRTVWIGDPDVLPVAGWEVEGSGGLAVGVTEGLIPTVTDRWRLDGGRGGAALRDAVADALTGRTARLGAQLAPMAVRYVIIVDRPSPQPFSPVEVPAPAGAVAALEEQLDLEQVPLAPGASLFRTTAPWPLRSDVTGGAVPGATPPPAVLGGGFGTSFRGEVPPGATVVQAADADPGWSLRTAGGRAEATAHLGWGQRFDTADGGDATLSYATPWGARVLQSVQVLALVALLVLVGRRRGLGSAERRRHVRSDGPVVVVGAPTDDAGPDTDAAEPEADRAGPDTDAAGPDFDDTTDDPATEGTEASTTAVGGGRERKRRRRGGRS
jgi:GT2 family glycosyltransferase